MMILNSSINEIINKFANIVEGFLQGRDRAEYLTSSIIHDTGKRQQQRPYKFPGKDLGDLKKILTDIILRNDEK